MTKTIFSSVVVALDFSVAVPRPTPTHPTNDSINVVILTEKN
jgi:hypothetical protein